MSGVFLSYSRTDQEVGERVVAGLRALGVECWWDADMRGVPWQEELERQINGMAALVVIWTQASKNSAYVRAEAALALNAGKLVNALVGETQPPFPFNGINGLPLDGWDGREPHSGWTRLVSTIEDCLVKVDAAAAGQITAALATREHRIAEGRDAVAAAELRYAEAQAADSDAREAVERAAAALKTCEDQLGRLGEMRPSAAVMRAAQSEFEDARDAASQAEEARRAAAGDLSGASRAVAAAKASLEAMFEAPPHHAAAAAPPSSTTAPALPAGHRRLTPALAIGGVILLLAVAAGGFALFGPHAPPALSVFEDAQASLRGDWADARQPACPTDYGQLVDLAVDHAAGGQMEITVAAPGAPAEQTQTIHRVRPGVFQLTFADGVWTYAANKDTLTITAPEGGEPSAYRRCDRH